jgi:hypothetical protein
MDIETKEQELRNERNESLAIYAKLEAEWRQVVAERDDLKAKLEKQPRWISVKQAMPPEKQVVLGFFQLYGMNLTSWFQWETMEKPLWGPGFREWGDVTHWMPLPIAPKEGEGDR